MTPINPQRLRERRRERDRLSVDLLTARLQHQISWMQTAERIKREIEAMPMAGPIKTYMPINPPAEPAQPGESSVR